MLCFRSKHTRSAGIMKKTCVGIVHIIASRMFSCASSTVGLHRVGFSIGPDGPGPRAPNFGAPQITLCIFLFSRKTPPGKHHFLGLKAKVCGLRANWPIAKQNSPSFWAKIV